MDHFQRTTTGSLSRGISILSIKKGIDVHLLSRLMGHSSIVITEKVYADYIQSDVHKEVREKLSFTF